MDHHAGQLQAEYAASGHVVIPEFADVRLAGQVADYLASGMPADWWYASTWPGPGGQRLDLRCQAESTAAVMNAFSIAHQQFLHGDFAYAFLRTLPHVQACGCLLCSAIAMLEDPATVARIRTLTGAEIERSGGLFASWYVPGSFLSPHTDEGNGRIALVWQLAREWQPQFGGLLHLLSDDSTQVRRVVVPEFNSAVLFRIPSPGGTPHFVSHVALGVRPHRLAISGWYG